MTDIAEAKERKSGIELAETYNAPKTAAIIADKDACFEDIFNSGVAEIGAAKFLEALKHGPRRWAQMAAHLNTDLGADSNTLVTNLATTSDPNAAKPGEPISAFVLFQGAPVSGIARINQCPDVTGIMKNTTKTFIPDALGIPPGTTMRFYFGIEDDVFVKLAAAPETFPYDPNSSKVAYYASWGPAGSQKFSLEDHPGGN